MLVHDTSTYPCFFCSTVRIRFPFKESKVVADVGDSVGLVCSAQGFPLNVIWKKNQAGSSAVIKRKTIYATINLGPVLTTAFSKVCLFFVVIENASIDLRPQYRFYAISTVGTKTLKNDRIARRDVLKLNSMRIIQQTHVPEIFSVIAFSSMRFRLFTLKWGVCIFVWSTFKSVFKSIRFRWKRSAY